MSSVHTQKSHYSWKWGNVYLFIAPSVSKLGQAFRAWWPGVSDPGSVGSAIKDGMFHLFYKKIALIIQLNRISIVYSNNYRWRIIYELCHNAILTLRNWTRKRMSKSMYGGDTANLRERTGLAVDSRSHPICLPHCAQIFHANDFRLSNSLRIVTCHSKGTWIVWFLFIVYAKNVEVNTVFFRIDGDLYKFYLTSRNKNGWHFSCISLPWHGSL